LVPGADLLESPHGRAALPEFIDPPADDLVVPTQTTTVVTAGADLHNLAPATAGRNDQQQQMRQPELSKCNA